jgi:hypothetical protein
MAMPLEGVWPGGLASLMGHDGSLSLIPDQFASSSLQIDSNRTPVNLDSQPCNQGAHMKYLLITTLSLFTLGSFAQDDLNEKKQKMNSKLDERMQQMEEARNCVNAADSQDELKQCKHEWKAKKHRAKAQRMEDKGDKKQKEEESLDE